MASCALASAVSGDGPLVESLSDATPVASVADSSSSSLSRIATSIRYLSSLGSRVSGYPGNRAASDYVEETLRSCGFEVRREEFEVTVPLDRGANLRVPAGGRGSVAAALHGVTFTRASSAWAKRYSSLLEPQISSAAVNLARASFFFPPTKCP